MEDSLPVPGWNAHRRPQSPLRQPKYSMREVPKAEKDLRSSQIQEIRDRDHFKEAMAEMVLLCTEAMHRTSANRCSSKPLSLEYIADRLDVDDPSFGYIVRSTEGMMQGFITVTTFTNWQKTFRWDSLHELAFYYDDSDSEDEHDVVQGPKKQRRVDRDGSLARELEQTVRLGDPYNEGIVWPRIAEISLLGAIGCGRKLVQLVIEQLEFQKASGTANYDYIALQATDNSISFYESLGFVRVGAVTVQPPKKDDQEMSTSSGHESSSSVAAAEPLPPSSPEKLEALATPLSIVSSPLTTYEVKKPGESPSYIAKKQNVDVWDIIFLNKDIYKDLSPNSRMKRGTILHLPTRKDLKMTETMEPTRWYIAKENDTPKMIANKFSLACRKLVEANRKRLQELMASSRLKAGTRVKISNLDHEDDICEPYCHWSFPDDSSVDGGEPSYMMVYKLERKSARETKQVRLSLSIPIKHYSPAPLLHPKPQPRTKIIPFTDHPAPPPPPPKAIDIFKNHMRDIFPELNAPTPTNIAELDSRWKNLRMEKKRRYEAVAKETSRHFEDVQEEYAIKYRNWEEECKKREPITVIEKDPSLFNKVVKIRDGAPEGDEYSYWFVLTYIPDLKWCHLAPMYKDGVHGPDRKRSAGRTKWRLVDESLGKELDISSTYCIPIRSRTLRKTADADKEEWDILDDEEKSDLQSKDSELKADNEPRRIIRKQPMRARSAVKPMGGKLAVVKSPQKLAISTQLKKTTNAQPRTSTAKRNDIDDMAPPRKARRINSAGAKRCALQS